MTHIRRKVTRLPKRRSILSFIDRWDSEALASANMKIICVGHMKTGTKSLAKALRMFGYNVYDFDDQLLHHLDFWFDVLQKGAPPDVRSLYQNSERDIEALIDLPSTFFFEEILESFPNVKVIQTVRNEDAWVQSMANQMRMNEVNFRSNKKKIMSFFSPTKRKIDAIVRSYFHAFIGTTNPNAQAVLRKRYRQHNANVKAVVPKDKLLVFDVKQGWKPLCEFLSCDVPECSFPHENIKGEIATPRYALKYPAVVALANKIGKEVSQGLMVMLAIAAGFLILVVSFVFY